MMNLINADCMDYLRAAPDQAFDLAVVDPPYGGGYARRSVNNAGKVYGTSRTAWKQYGGSGLWDDERPTPEYFKELKRASRWQIIWGGNYFMDIIRAASACWLVWDKRNSGKFADGELAYTSFQTATRIFRYRWAGMIQQDMSEREARIHPTQKPVALYSWIFENYAPAGGKVIDTHLGSGSSAIAAHYAGLEFTGIEKDPHYFAAAEERISEQTRQTKMEL